MPSIDQRLELLNAVPPEHRVPILASALTHAAEPEREPICRQLMATGGREAVLAVLRHLHQLDEAAIDRLGSMPADLRAAVGVALDGPWPQAAWNALDLVERRLEPAALQPLAQRLPMLDDSLGERVAGVILAVTSRLLGPSGRRGIDDADRSELEIALVAAASTHRRHRRDEVLVATAMAAARPGPALRSVLEDQDHPVSTALRRLTRRIEEPAVRGNLIRWLSGPMQRIAARAMESGRDPQVLADLLRDSHLLLATPRRRGIRMVARPARCIPDRVTSLELTETDQSRLPRFVEALDLSSIARIRAMAQIATLPVAPARLHALLVLAGHGTAEASEAITQLTADADPAIATIAVQQLRSSRRDDVALWRRLERGPHAALARTARLRLGAMTAADFFERWTELDHAERLVAATRLRRADDDGALTDGLRTAIISGRGQRAERLLAIGLARHIQLVTTLEDPLIHAASGDDLRVASAAIAALADGTSDRSLGAIERAIDHPDTRVSANAIEALARRGRGRAADRLSHLVAVRRNRPRGNAIRALMRHRPTTGLEGLRAMLGDRDPLHRVSAIWVARQSCAGSVIDQLRGIAATDRIPVIRSRADEAVRRVDRMEAASSDGATR